MDRSFTLLKLSRKRSSHLLHRAVCGLGAVSIGGVDERGGEVFLNKYGFLLFTSVWLFLLDLVNLQDGYIYYLRKRGISCKLHDLAATSHAFLREIENPPTHASRHYRVTHFPPTTPIYARHLE